MTTNDTAQTLYNNTIAGITALSKAGGWGFGLMCNSCVEKHASSIDEVLMVVEPTECTETDCESRYTEAT